MSLLRFPAPPGPPPPDHSAEAAAIAERLAVEVAAINREAGRVGEHVGHLRAANDRLQDALAAAVAELARARRSARAAWWVAAGSAALLALALLVR